MFSVFCFTNVLKYNEPFLLKLLTVSSLRIRQRIFAKRVFCSGVNEEDDETDEGMNGADQVGSSGMPPVPNQPGKTRHKSHHFNRKKHKLLANKPQDFQVLSYFDYFSCITTNTNLIWDSGMFP